MIHDLYLRAYVVVCGEAKQKKEQPAKRSRSPKLWPEYALGCIVATP